MLGKLYDWALIYRDMDLCPIPLYRRNDPLDASGNKRPMVAGWQNLTLPDDIMLERWFCDDRRNIGIVCGRPSGNLMVLDFDDMQAYATWLDVASPPETLTVNTGGGGVHCYYRLTGDVPGNQKLIGGDVRGQGGQAVAPPSVHLSGKVYEVRHAATIATTTLAALHLLYPARPAGASRVRRKPFVTGDFRPIVQTLAEAEEGERNNMLLWCACRLFEQGLPLAQVRQILTATALHIGLERPEVVATIASAQKQTHKAPAPLPPHQILAARLQRHGIGRA